MEHQLHIHEKMLFALLRYSLHCASDNDPIFAQATPEDWNQCYKLSVAQGVMAVSWDGVMLLPASLQPPVEVKLNWAVSVGTNEQMYEYYCGVMDEMSALLGKRGMTAVQIKGLGISSYYPVPSHRENGDIDIYVIDQASRMEPHETIYEQVNQIMVDQGLSVDTESSKKHSTFYYQGVPIENHKSFLNPGISTDELDQEGFLQGLLRPRPVSLGEGHQIYIPSDDFNFMFIPYHAAQHYGSGICLHHLFDWACLLKTCGMNIPDGMKDQGMLRFIYALTQLCNQIFVMNIEVPDESSLAADVLNDMLRSPFHYTLIPTHHSWDILVFKVKRMRYLSHFERIVFQKSIWKTIRFSILFHLKHPQLILGTSLSKLNIINDK